MGVHVTQEPTALRGLDAAAQHDTEHTHLQQSSEQRQQKLLQFDQRVGPGMCVRVYIRSTRSCLRTVAKGEKCQKSKLLMARTQIG